MENKKDTNKEKTQQEIKKQKQKKANEDFKKKYFEYYDDIKISDRQDW